MVVTGILKKHMYYQITNLNVLIAAFQYNWLPCNLMHFRLHIYKHSKTKTTGITTWLQVSTAHNERWKTQSYSLARHGPAIHMHPSRRFPISRDKSSISEAQWVFKSTDNIFHLVAAETETTVLNTNFKKI